MRWKECDTEKTLTWQVLGGYMGDEEMAMDIDMVDMG